MVFVQNEVTVVQNLVILVQNLVIFVQNLVIFVQNLVTLLTFPEIFSAMKSPLKAKADKTQRDRINNFCIIIYLIKKGKVSLV